MNRTILPSPYDNRWTALYNRLEKFEEDIRTQANNPTNIDSTRAYALCQIAMAAYNLRAFANSQLDYFVAKAAKAPSGYQPEYGLALTLHQIGFDLEVLEQAASQRLKSFYKKESNATKDWDTLNIADRMARGITEAVKAKFPELGLSTALVYFQKSPRFHGMPYAPIALTAIPYTAIDERSDLLATPHEIGHYVFSRLNTKTSFIREFTMLAEDSWVGAWTEEIFADVFGYMVGGPLVGASLQGLLLRHNDKTFATADVFDTHPTPALRPFIHNLVLNLLGQSQLGASLMTHWKAKLGVRKVATKASGHYQVDTPFGPERNIDDLVSTNGISMTAGKPINHLVNQIFTQLNPLASTSWAGDVSSGQLSTDTEIKNALDAFNSVISTIAEPINLPADCQPIPEEVDPWHQWRIREGLTDDDWLDIAHARGWVERPPDNWPKTG